MKINQKRKIMFGIKILMKKIWGGHAMFDRNDFYINNPDATTMLPITLLQHSCNPDKYDLSDD